MLEKNHRQVVESLPTEIVTGYLFAICATAIWSGNFMIARGLNESIPPNPLNSIPLADEE